MPIWSEGFWRYVSCIFINDLLGYYLRHLINSPENNQRVYFFLKMNTYLKIILLTGSMFFCSCLSAQISVRQTVYQFNAWAMYFGNHRISQNWNLHTEYQWRRSEGFTYWAQSLARIGFDYRLKDNVMVTAGYGHIKTFPYGEQPLPTSVVEHRAWEQLVLTHQSGRVFFNHRYRLEQRWIENMKPAQNGDYYREGFVYSNRFRYKFTFNVPLNGTQIQKGTLFASVYDEPFISFGKNVRFNIFDQNRLYGAIGYQFHAAGNIQLGYLNQIILKPDGTRQEMNHTLQLGLTYNMDWRKKQG